MLFYMAPMEGLTGYIVRNAYHHHFHNIDKYFTPFIPAGKNLNNKYLRDIDPENNKDINLIPQLISNDAEEVLDMQKKLAAFGYSEVNLNMGCPSGTVVSKKRGSGILKDTDLVERFLDTLFEKADFPVSIKTRIGYYDEEEWEELARIYAKYPISELIIHPRTREDLYKGPVRFDTFAHAVEHIPVSLCFNGDIVDKASYERVITAFPQIDKVMIGRGLFRHPDMVSELKGEEPVKMSQIRAYHDEILEGYRGIFSGEKDALFRMKEHWSYLGDSFEGIDKARKVIRKTNHMSEYLQAVDEIFRNGEYTAL